MCEEVIKLPSVFPSLISDLSISHGLLLCSGSQLHHSSSFLDLPGADVQGSAADRQTEHLGTGQGDAPGTALGGKEQKVTGSPRAVSVSAHDLSSLKKSF